MLSKYIIHTICESVGSETVIRGVRSLGKVIFIMNRLVLSVPVVCLVLSRRLNMASNIPLLCVLLLPAGLDHIFLAGPSAHILLHWM
jgi:hypothetical protein